MRKFITTAVLINFFLAQIIGSNLNLYNNSPYEIFNNNQVSISYFNPNYGFVSSLATFNQYNLPLNFTFAYSPSANVPFRYEIMGFNYGNFSLPQDIFTQGAIVNISGVKTSMSWLGREYDSTISAFVSPQTSIGTAYITNMKPAFWGYDFVNKNYQGFTLPTGSSLWRANFTSLGGQVEFFASVSQNLYTQGKVNINELVSLSKSGESALSSSDKYKPITFAGSNDFFVRLTNLFPQSVQSSQLGIFFENLDTQTFAKFYQPGVVLHERGNLVKLKNSFENTTSANFYVREFVNSKGMIEGLERKKGRESEDVVEKTDRMMKQPGSLGEKQEEIKSNVLQYKQFVTPQGIVYDVTATRNKDGSVKVAFSNQQSGQTFENVGYRPDDYKVSKFAQKIEEHQRDLKKVALLEQKIQQARSKQVLTSDEMEYKQKLLSGMMKEYRTKIADLNLRFQEASNVFAGSMVYDNKSLASVGILGLEISATPDKLIKYSQFYINAAKAATEGDYLGYTINNLLRWQQYSRKDRPDYKWIVILRRCFG